MYPWYRDAGQLGQFNPQAMPAAIKTESGYNDCMLALDYAAQSKKAAFVWSSPPPASEVSSAHGGGKGGGVVAGGTPPGAATPGSAQGLVHWMSVMAEHMNNPHTHDVHYMWNNVEVSISISPISTNDFATSRIFLFPFCA
ncbi:Hypothetical predicted protein [Cloeon dipterum]|nr:Hypothetical predicted protein [Cloeon dipterum]